MTTELDEQFSVVDRVFESSVKQLIPIRGLLTKRRTEYVGYDVVRSYE